MKFVDRVLFLCLIIIIGTFFLIDVFFTCTIFYEDYKYASKIAIVIFNLIVSYFAPQVVFYIFIKMIEEIEEEDRLEENIEENEEEEEEELHYKELL